MKPVRCRDVSPTSQMRVEIQIKRLWATKDRVSKEINPQELYNDYWTSKIHDLTLEGEL